jgi:DNA mismatch repair protein MutL
MKKVHLLSSDIISKIAAGEMIERPASVIKELVENSLDAGADSIEVNLQNAGKTLISIKDNGSGIDKDDLEDIFLRHATSKIQTLDDLFNIHSLGFRGEALYSVAAISDVILRSKTKEQTEGWEIHLRGGEKIKMKPAGLARPGTEIEVKELFFNTPARRKFLKTNVTENNQILSVIIPYALLYPHCQFKLTHEGRDLLHLSAAEKLTERIADTLNLKQQHLISTEGAIPEKEVNVKMILGDMNIRRGRRDMQFLFVNNRPVQNKNILFHLSQAYRLILPPDTYPFFAVYIDLPAENVDVNIHPTKREVKIKDESSIALALKSIAEETLMKEGSLKQVNESSFLNIPPAERALRQSTGMDSSIADNPRDHYESSLNNDSSLSARHSYPTRQAADQQHFFIPKEGIFAGKDSLQKKIENARFIGIFIQKFILFESGSSLLMIDQHAAAERITYEQLIRQMEKGSVEVQHLLSPVVIQLAPQEFLLWEEGKDRLEKIGFSSNQWDKESIAIHTHPTLIWNVEKTIRELLSGETIARCDHETIARRACRSSIMAGDRLNAQQAEFQREQLLQCLDPFTCPHGRPTVIELTEGFLDKQFLRC